MCSVMYTHPYSEKYAVSIMGADEIFFFAFVAILVKYLVHRVTSKILHSSHNKERLVPGLVTENTLALCEMGLEVLGDIWREKNETSRFLVQATFLTTLVFTFLLFQPEGRAGWTLHHFTILIRSPLRNMAYIYTHTHIHTHTHTYVYIHTLHIYIHTYIRTYNTATTS